MNTQNESLTFDEIIKHLDAGYQNMQSVARFVDTKTTAIVAGLTAVVGLQAALGKWIVPALDIYLKKIHGWGGIWFFFPWVFFALGIAAVYQCYKSAHHCYSTLIPRDIASSPASALFPFINPATPDASQLARIDLYATDPLQIHVAEDYIGQLKRMGEINYEKITNCNLAIKWFFRLLATSILVLIASVELLYVTH